MRAMKSPKTMGGECVNPEIMERKEEVWNCK